MVAAQAVPRGQQVLINYGSQSNDALLQRYGFVEDGNPQDRCARTAVRQYGTHKHTEYGSSSPPSPGPSLGWYR